MPTATVSKSKPNDSPILTVGVSSPFSHQFLSGIARYQMKEKLLQSCAGHAILATSTRLCCHV